MELTIIKGKRLLVTRTKVNSLYIAEISTKNWKKNVDIDLVQQLKERKLAELVEVFAEDINSGDEDGLLKRLEVDKMTDLKHREALTLNILDRRK